MMDNFEVLKSLKQMWEMWFDLHENSDIMSDAIYNTFERTLSQKYSLQYLKMLKEEPETLIIGIYNGKQLIVGDIIMMDYVYKDAPAVYETGGDIGYHWWNDLETNPFKQKEKGGN